MRPFFAPKGEKHRQFFCHHFNTHYSLQANRPSIVLYNEDPSPPSLSHSHRSAPPLPSIIEEARELDRGAGPMEGDGGWHYGGHGYNNWDLDAVVRLGGGGGNAALEPFQDDPILALLQPQQDVLPGALPPPQQDVMPDALPQQQQGVLPDANPWQELQGAMDLPMAADPAFADLDAFLSDPVFAAPQSPPPPSQRNEAPAPQQAPAAEPPALGKAAAEPSSDAGAGSSRPKHAYVVNLMIISLYLLKNRCLP